MDMPQFDDMDLVMVSALEHYSYCPRQCALIHVEQIYDENIYTIKGSLLHDKVHEESSEMRDGVRIERGLPIWSRKFGLVGKADLVEFHGDVPYPVEYKHGRKKKWGHEDLQVCAQGLCLEEMTGISVPKGAIFHHGSQRRREVIFDDNLRGEVIRTVDAIRNMLKNGITPSAANDARCTNCSLMESCLPALSGEPERIRLAARLLFEIGKE